MPKALHYTFGVNVIVVANYVVFQAIQKQLPQLDKELVALRKEADCQKAGNKARPDDALQTALQMLEQQQENLHAQADEKQAQLSVSIFRRVMIFFVTNMLVYFSTHMAHNTL